MNTPSPRPLKMAKFNLVKKIYIRMEMRLYFVIVI